MLAVSVSTPLELSTAVRCMILGHCAKILSCDVPEAAGRRWVDVADLHRYWQKKKTGIKPPNA